MPENMIQQTELPQIHLIRDTDLGVFAYELHILAGDFLRESEFNLRTLATNTGVDSIAIMGKRHMWLSDAVFAYCSTGDLRQMALTTEYIGARAFLFHADRKEDGHLYGDVLMMDLDTLRDFGAWLESEGLQAIATRVSTGEECQIIIEDGMALSAPEATQEPPKWKAGEF